MRWAFRVAAKAARLRQYWFPDRLLILRDGDRMRSLKLTSMQQVTLVGGAILAGVWMLGATLDAVYHRGVLIAKENEITRTRQSYHELVDEVANQNGKVQAITKDLEVYRSYLLAVVEQDQNLQRDVHAFGAEVRDSAVAAKPAAPPDLRGQLAKVEKDISQLSERNDLMQDDVELMRQRLAASASERVRFAEARAVLDQHVSRLEHERDEARASANDLQALLGAKENEVAQAQAARAAAEADRDKAVAELGGAQQRIASLLATHQQSLNQISERTRSTISEVERIVGATGLNLKQLLPVRSTKGAARGGPFVPLHSVPSHPDVLTQATTSSLFSDFDRLDELRLVLRSIPLAAPLATFEVTDPFGPRIDPFNGQRAMHTGIDLQGAMRSPVSATAAGKVVSAGWHAAYGRFVEIDHGLGISTRYAHLDQILVKDGQEVALGTKIGLLGHSGRATGPHLHYEVVVNGRPTNPVNFLKANAHVSESH
jgi:murein DD-endopeptidase MepM/ murein hydrolase activator NlpD